MGLVDCPDCGKSISDKASECIGCGRPMAPARRSKARRKPAPAHDDPACSKCGSRDVQSLELIHLAGRSRLNALSVGVGTTGDRLGLGAASSTGSYVTELAMLAAPPPKEENSDGDALRAATVVLIGGSVLVAIWIPFRPVFDDFTMVLMTIPWILALFAARKISSAGRAAAERYNAKVWPDLHERWLASEMCMRCGHITVSKQ